MTSLNEKKLLKDFLSNNKKALLSQTLLAVIALSAIPFVAMGAIAMGNGVQILKIFNKKGYSKEHIAKGIHNLRRYKMVEFVEHKSGNTTIQITQKGKSYLRTFSLDLLEIKKQKRWDGKWRIVMFDLPVRYAKIRNSLRLKLKQLGFVQFQKSVWIYPYQCHDELLFLIDYYKVGKYVEILIIDQISNDKKLRALFNL